MVVTLFIKEIDDCDFTVKRDRWLWLYGIKEIDNCDFNI